MENLIEKKEYAMQSLHYALNKFNREFGYKPDIERWNDAGNIIDYFLGMSSNYDVDEMMMYFRDILLRYTRNNKDELIFKVSVNPQTKQVRLYIQ